MAMATFSYSVALFMVILSLTLAAFSAAGVFPGQLPTGQNIGNMQAVAAGLTQTNSSVNSDPLTNTISMAWKSMTGVLGALGTFLYVGGFLKELGCPWYIADILIQPLIWFCYLFDLWQLVPKILPYMPH